jgi:hypothetical protein
MECSGLVDSIAAIFGFSTDSKVRLLFEQSAQAASDQRTVIDNEDRFHIRQIKGRTTIFSG